MRPQAGTYLDLNWEYFLLSFVMMLHVALMASLLFWSLLLKPGSLYYSSGVYS